VPHAGVLRCESGIGQQPVQQFIRSGLVGPGDRVDGFQLVEQRSFRPNVAGGLVDGTTRLGLRPGRISAKLPDGQVDDNQENDLVM